ncbi:MAG: metallophosphoesterase [Actinomycetes bacterium]
MKQLGSNRTLRFARTKAENGYTRTHLEIQAGEPLEGSAPGRVSPLATFLHMSDLHVCDAQSPARVEYLDRYADPDYPTRALVEYVGTYRPQEFLTVQVVEAMVQSLNEIEFGPLFGGAVDGVLITGDVIDNGQANELSWYQNLLHGGTVSSASGNAEKVEAAHSIEPGYDQQHYYQPDNVAGNRTNELFGMVARPGLAMAAQQPFVATGLRHQWFAVHGNHDAMLQGTVLADDHLKQVATGSLKYTGLVEGVPPEKLFENFTETGPAGYPNPEILTTTEVTPDGNRRIIEMTDWVESHIDCGHNHGITQQHKTAYWFKDFGQVRVIALDTVNAFGGWQGCIDREQLAWMTDLLETSTDKYVVLTSHHALLDLVNGWAPEGHEVSAEKAEVTELLANYPNVIAWVAGHVHDHNISFQASSKGDFGFWQIRTSSHMDWPQQSRVIEIGRADDGRLVIGTQVANHAGAELTHMSQVGETTDDQLNQPLHLAGISRILSANDWQCFDGKKSLEVLEGQPGDRNAWLWLNDPLA